MVKLLRLRAVECSALGEHISACQHKARDMMPEGQKEQKSRRSKWCSEMLSFGLHMAVVALMNPLQLWLPGQDLHIIKSAR